MKYLISYDLRSRNKRDDRSDDRRKIGRKLKKMGAVRVLESQWVIEKTRTRSVQPVQENLRMGPVSRGQRRPNRLRLAQASRTQTRLLRIRRQESLPKQHHLVPQGSRLVR